MRVWYEDDPETDTCTAHLTGVSIDDEPSLQKWLEVTTAASREWLARRNGQKWFCLIDLSDFELAPEMAPAYGACAKNLMNEFYTGAVRYGSPTGVCTQSALRLGAIKNKFPSNIFEDRQAALVALTSIRASVDGEST